MKTALDASKAAREASMSQGGFCALTQAYAAISVHALTPRGAEV